MMHKLIISHLTEDVWKTTDGIVRFKKAKEVRKTDFSCHKYSYAHAYGVDAFLLIVTGVPISRHAP